MKKRQVLSLETLSVWVREASQELTVNFQASFLLLLIYLHFVTSAREVGLIKIALMPPKAKAKKEDPKEKEPSNFVLTAEPEEEEKPEEKPQVIRHGFGRFEYQNGTIYEGQWIEVDGVKAKHGEGYLVHAGNNINDVAREEYKGSWKNDMMDGFGVYKYISGATYTGEWVENKHQGKGTYEFPDGTVYSGEWRNHRMDGEGSFIDKQNRKWQGEFVEGVFQSKVQKKLKYDKMISLKKVEIEKSARDFLEHFKSTFETSDKKSYKEKMLPFFSNSCAEELRVHIREPFVKYEERKPDVWGDLITFLASEEASLNILLKASSSRLLDPSNILAPQFKGFGQVVELDRMTPERKSQLALCQIADEKWVVIYHADVIEKPTKDGKK